MGVIDSIREKRNICESSIKAYVSSLKRIQKEIDYKGGLDNTNFLDDYKNILDKIDKFKSTTTKKNMITAIIVALKSNDNDKTNIIDEYTKKLKEYTDEYNTFLKKQEKTEKQKQNWLEYDDIIKIINKIMDEIKIHVIHTNPSTLNKYLFDKLQQLVILKTYMAFPIRNNFANMRIVSKREYDSIPQSEKSKNNYMVSHSNHKNVFHINNFKNREHMDKKAYDITGHLSKIIKLWLSYNTSGWFLVGSDGITPMNSNMITKYLNKIFKSTNKKISTSMLRHIIISHTMRDKPTIKEELDEEKDIENKYMHTADMNKIYRKIDK